MIISTLYANRDENYFMAIANTRSLLNVENFGFQPVYNRLFLNTPFTEQQQKLLRNLPEGT